MGWLDKLSAPIPGHLAIILITRELRLFGEVSDIGGDYSMAMSMLNVLEKDDPKAPIHIYLNSVGGDPQDGMAFVDALHRVKAPLCIIATGVAYSAAADIIALSPHGTRYATPSTTFMMHGVKYSLPEDSASVQKTWASWEDKQEANFMDRMVKHLKLRGGKAGKFRNQVKETWIFDAKEALRWGIIDGIWEAGK